MVSKMDYYRNTEIRHESQNGLGWKDLLDHPIPTPAVGRDSFTSPGCSELSVPSKIPKPSSDKDLQQLFSRKTLKKDYFYL